MKNTLRKVILGSSALAMPLTTLIFAACSKSEQPATQSSRQVSVDYDLGLTSEPINNLNYIRYKSMDKLLPALIDPLIKSGPTASLKSLIHTNNFNFVLVDTKDSKNDQGQESSNFNDLFKLSKELEDKDGYGLVQASYYNFSSAFELVGGIAASSQGDIVRNGSFYAFRNPKNSNNYMALTAKINNKLNRWSNGDYISANDVRDYLEYILDINTGSQRLDQIRKFGIRGAERFIDAQKEYLQKFNTQYINPWGRRKYIKDKDGNFIQDPEQKVWQSQAKDANGNPMDDSKEVEAIKQAALNFGFYTGQIFLDYSNEEIEKNLEYNKGFDLETNDNQTFKIKTGTNAKNEPIFKTVTLVKNDYLNPYQKFIIKDNKIVASFNQIANSENVFTVIFDENRTPSLSFLITQIMTNLYPANRKYIETVAGGIDKFGSNPYQFLTSGPFKMNPKEVILGPQGEINLEKDKDYFDATNTISNKIKIYFSTDRNINSTFFEDGYISQTYIPAQKINKYWSNQEYKDYLNKNVGYGTIAFGFNLDEETNAQSYIQDQDLRNAIYYSINRENIIKFVGWDFSFPVNTWTAYGQYKTVDGKNIETFFSDLQASAKNNKEFAVQNYDYVVHLSKGYTFEKTSRGDIAFDVDTAQYYINRFKQKHPNLKQVKLTFLNNSTDEQKKAGTFLKEAVKHAFGGFVEIEVKSLPENTFASFIETGKYDIIYQNYDKIGGNGAHDYIAAFFRRDEIDSLIQKSIGFKDNPVGSFTYADYIADLVLEKQQKTREEILAPLIQKIVAKINSNTGIKQEFYSIKTEDDSKKLDIVNFANKYSIDFAKEFSDAQDADAKLLSQRLIKELLERELISNKNIKIGRLKRAFNTYLVSKMSVKEIAELTKDTEKRLKFEQSIDHQKYPEINFWEKFIELSLQKDSETTSQYSSRLSAFFSANFSQEELKQQWKETFVYVLIGHFEKIVRDGAFVIPLMEVDTNWEITKVGGVSSVFTFALQYAYDFTRPPKAGLPRKRG
ncbi:ABC transporter substrate-binding protein [Mycoplasma procyoni]|uniref:ABC transporter substrate-binding protein n=1 Tax=Mycoplasma procyoni TaxID=568784 RepID=UPI00197BE955|nr:ABC transporter substrate-binding protein [Mycoplasma procyoni]MBN3534755.1 peptide ABC transporter substrate-binding protein [Mycoplasma procyoni]